MNLHAQTDAGQNGSQVLPRLNVLILYENRIAGLHAKESLDRCVSQVDYDLGYSLDVCRFDLLEDNEVRQSTTRQSVENDVVVVALHGGHNLPVTLRDWLDKWLRLKGDEPCALVFLCDEQTSGMAHQTIDFTQIPSRANVEVFQCVRSLEPTTFDQVLQQLSHRENSSSKVLDGILYRREPSTHWGIND